MAFMTKPELAHRMIERAVAAGIPFSWVTADEAYGGNPKLRKWLEEQGIPYVMAVSCDAVISTAAGKRADERRGQCGKAGGAAGEPGGADDDHGQGHQDQPVGDRRLRHLVSDRALSAVARSTPELATRSGT